MPRITIIVGAILIAIGVVGYLATGFASWTALIPAIIGALIAVFGVVGIRRPKLGVHVALTVAILGIAGTLMNVLKLGEVFAGTAERPVAVIASTLTFALLIGYVAVGVRSFVAARRWKAENASSTV